VSQVRPNNKHLYDVEPQTASTYKILQLNQYEFILYSLLY